MRELVNRPEPELDYQSLVFVQYFNKTMIVAERMKDTHTEAEILEFCALAGGLKQMIEKQQKIISNMTDQLQAHETTIQRQKNTIERMKKENRNAKAQTRTANDDAAKLD